MTVVPERETRWLVVTGAAAAALAIGLLAFWFGRQQAGVDLERIDALTTDNAALQEQLGNARKQIVDLELAADIDRQAALELQETIKQLRDESADLGKEVTLYKSLMAPSSLERGLQIADFELTVSDQPGAFDYRLLLTQVAQRRNWVEGRVSVSVAGTGAVQGGAGNEGEEGSQQVLPLTELGHDGKYPLSYRFRYFQDLSGTVSLPDGFQPLRIVVSADPKGRGDTLERTFDWQVIED